MPSKRRQFSSCEACRKSRLGCDAQRTSGASCSNCARRQKTCVVKWPKPNGKPATKTKPDPPLSPSTLSPSSAIASANRYQEGRALDGALFEVFANVYESRMSNFLESHSCPVLSVRSEGCSPCGKSIMALMVSLDSQESNHVTSLESLMHPTMSVAIRAFSLKYLMAEKNRTGKAQRYTAIQDDDCFKYVWKQAIQAATHAMNLQSYQSALALYIIGLASMSMHGMPPDFERTCLRIASQHISKLRPYEDDFGSDDYSISGHKVAYLCAALSDNAFQFNQPRESREPTLFRMNDQIWATVRERTYIFHKSFERVHGMHEPMSKEVLSTVLQHATMFKSMMWWNFNNKQHDRLDLMIHDALVFRKVFAPLLDLVSRDFVLIHPREQLSYILVTIHFHWAILLLIEEIDELGLNGQGLSELASVRSIVNATNQAQLVSGIHASRHAFLLDPMPETMADAMSTTASSLLRLYGKGQISLGATQSMLSVVISGLEVVRRVSLKADDALEEARKSAKKMFIPAK